MKAVLLAFVIVAIAGCSAPILTPEPAAGPPADQVDCRGFDGEITQCLTIEAAAAKAVGAEPGSRAKVTTVDTDKYDVSLISPSGARSSADVIVDSQGRYVAVDTTSGP